MAVAVSDTGVLIDFLAGVDPAAAVILEELENSDLAISPVTRTELLLAAKPGRQETQVRQLLNGLHLLPIDEAVSDKAVELSRHLKTLGRNISLPHCFLAAATIRSNGRLLTRNREVFKGIPGLRVVFFGG